MDIYFVVKTIHIISSTILFGTGIGIAFFMFSSKFTNSLIEKLYAARTTVLADYLFTLPAVITQVLTGAWLVNRSGYGWLDSWLLTTYAIYVLAGLCWLPVVWIQIQLRKILVNCVESNAQLPKRYHKLFNVWFILGWPAFIGLIVIFFLMVTKPV